MSHVEPRAWTMRPWVLFFAKRLGSHEGCGSSVALWKLKNAAPSVAKVQRTLELKAADDELLKSA